jgi:hypothetical protein
VSGPRAQSAHFAPVKGRRNRNTGPLCSALAASAFMRLGTVRRPTAQGDLFLVYYGIYCKYNYVSILWFISLGASNLPLSSSRWNSAAHSAFASFFSPTTFLGAPISCHLKPNNIVILIKYDNYTRSVIFLCKCSSSLPLHRTSGALPERLESLRSAEAPSRARGRFCSRASPSGATDCQPLKPALQPRSSSGCRQR